MQKRIITAADIRKASRSGQKSLLVPSDECIVTPMAKDEAIALDIMLNEEPETTSVSCDCPTDAPANDSDEKMQTQGALSVSAPTPDSPADLPAKQLDEVIQTVSQLIQTRGTSNVPAHQIENVVREIVSKKLGLTSDQNTLAEATPAVDNSQGVHFINAQCLLEQNGGLIAAPEKMFVAGVIGRETGEKLAGGYMVWEDAAFSRCVEAPEIAVVIDGELHLIIDGETMVSKPGDMIYFPEGAAVEYKAPGKVKLACINCV